MESELQKTAKKLSNAFKHGKLINPINRKFCDSSKQANILRSLCEEQIKSEIIGFKAGGTGKAMLKKWGEKNRFMHLSLKEILGNQIQPLKLINTI